MALAAIVQAACSLTPELDLEARQQRAIKRWERCVNDQAERLEKSRLLLQKQGASVVCEGYRRDVLDTYPPHLTPRINNLLIDRTEDRLASIMGRRLSEYL